MHSQLHRRTKKQGAAPRPDHKGDNESPARRSGRLAQLVPASPACSECGLRLHKDHVFKCSAQGCNKRLCKTHAIACSECEAVGCVRFVCADHAGVCDRCQTQACKSDIEACKGVDGKGCQAAIKYKGLCGACRGGLETPDGTHILCLACCDVV